MSQVLRPRALVANEVDIDYCEYILRQFGRIKNELKTTRLAVDTAIIQLRLTKILIQPMTMTRGTQSTTTSTTKKND